MYYIIDRQYILNKYSLSPYATTTVSWQNLYCFLTKL